MPEKKIQKIAEDADLIVKGYALKSITLRCMSFGRVTAIRDSTKEID